MIRHQPREIRALSEDTMTRMTALSSLCLFVLSMALARAGVLDFFGWPVLSSVSLACVAIAVLITNRTSYLPFLGETVFPSTLLKDATPSDATVEVTVQASPGATHVAFWASEPGPRQKTPWAAYGGYENSGVAKVDGSGSATLRFRCPASYAIRGKVLPPHVHYRDVFPSGILGVVKTAKVVCA